MIDLDALEKEHKESTAGEWRWHKSGFGRHQRIAIHGPDQHRDIVADIADAVAQDDANAAAIVVAHNALPALIAELREARKSKAAIVGAVLRHERERIAALVGDGYAPEPTEAEIALAMRAADKEVSRGE